MLIIRRIVSIYVRFSQVPLLTFFDQLKLSNLCSFAEFQSTHIFHIILSFRVGPLFNDRRRKVKLPVLRYQGRILRYSNILILKYAKKSSPENAYSFTKKFTLTPKLLTVFKKTFQNVVKPLILSINL